MALIGEDASLEEVQRVFRNDRFATDACGCRVVEASRGHAVCEFDITPGHRNEKGGVMGGAIFTVADLALAVASNVGEPVTVSVSSSIEFMSAAKGERLIATADVDKNGRTLGFYNCLVTDELGTPVARVTQTAMHLRQ
ncbi:PaaI family thioesterase [Thermophilibacter provencensis]|uniref:PaaI family thioesterase n=1 Tax=Thermophilibacter provencensis TaxID=1852386 RepID=UPI00094B6465|nr:PaaI family thioesterase [Thermophilibacter provencensis]